MVACKLCAESIKSCCGRRGPHKCRFLALVDSTCRRDIDRQPCHIRTLAEGGRTLSTRISGMRCAASFLTCSHSALTIAGNAVERAPFHNAKGVGEQSRLMPRRRLAGYLCPFRVQTTDVGN